VFFHLLDLNFGGFEKTRKYYFFPCITHQFYFFFVLKCIATEVFPRARHTFFAIL